MEENFDNSSDLCIYEEVGRWSDSLVYFSVIYLIVSVLIIIVTLVLWIRLIKKLVYLEKRGFGLITVMSFGFLLTLSAGPLPRTQNSEDSVIHRCLVANITFLLCIPTLTIGAILGVFVFTRQVKLGKILAKASEAEYEVTLKQLNRAWFQTTNRFALMVASIAFVFLFLVCFGVTYTLCPELGGDEFIIGDVTNPAIVVVFFASVVALLILCIYIARTLKTYPDPYDILRSVRNGLAITLAVQVPGLVLSTFDVGEPASEDRDEIYFTYGIFYDIPVFVLYLYFGPYQIYRAYKFNTFRKVYAEITLQKVLDDPTGRKLFKDHLINEFNYENLAFIEDVEEFKALSTVDERVIKAKEIYDSQFKHKRLNVSHPTMTDIEKRCLETDIDVDMFNEAYQEIWDLLESDPFHRFQSSAAFQVYVGTPTTETPTPSKSKRRYSSAEDTVSRGDTILNKSRKVSENDI